MARVAETKRVAEKWVTDTTKQGLEANCRYDYDYLRSSLREKLRQAELPLVKCAQEWAYARQVMDVILPAMRRAGHYKATQEKVSRARQSTAQTRARQSTAQPSTSGKAKKKRKLQKNNSASHGSTSASRPADSQRASVGQDRDNPQRGPRHWKRSQYKRGAPSPHKGSSSSERKN
jgi:hypothetical protein